ncbi:ribosome hibernation-promoting factor, HPF/YfiA family [Ostreibacterium oceani]|uniref:Ribosome hibernation promoting factor n=1 Tax=Ostreibacterium oceani TaxID=2654998 RepID=A0A6N7EVN0_9GAMM|nr:ribosome-associated translation inhibitor RaiA [Ostreibacterium oceani]MPV86542.1 ribosome-associated translation inhibitor RaiA [Ostreibacterium oceani]
MNLNITGHHVEVTDALRDYVTDKMARIEGHHDKIISVNVTLKVEKLDQKAEATLQLAGNTIHADSSKPDMYAAIDDMIDVLDRQVRHHKRRITDHRG